MPAIVSGRIKRDRQMIEALEGRFLLSGNMLAAQPLAAATAPVVIDLMVVYTAAAKTQAGGQSAMLSTINQAVADTNTVFSNSLINATVHLVHVEEVNYSEANSYSTDLDRLSIPNDGYLDSISALRDAYGADLVSMFESDSDPTAGGLGFMMTDITSPYNADLSFSIISTPQATAPSYTLAHELGHNFGCNHDRQTDPTPGAFDYSHGYHFMAGGKEYIDVMAYPPGETVPYFSNPNITYQGVPLGVANWADNARTINQTAPVVAAYRPSVVFDTAAPVPTLNGSSLSADGKTLTFTVTYTDETAVDIASLGNGDLTVTGPGGFNQPATFLRVDQNSSGTPRNATYSVTVSSGTIGFGAYRLNFQANQVKDMSGNYIAAGTGLPLSVADTAAPSAVLNAVNVTSPGSGVYTFNITFDDNVAVNVASLSSGITVSNTGMGFTQAAVLDSVDINSNGTPRTATYHMAPPGGQWDLADNGVYQVLIGAGKIKDSSNNAMAATTLGSFRVRIADVVLPQAQLNAPNLTIIKQRNYNFTVTYTDNAAVDVATLDSSDLLVTAAGGFSQAAVFDGLTFSGNGTPRTALYHLTSPNPTWRFTDNTTYQVSIVAGQVTDTAGNAVAAGVLGSFVMNIPVTDIAPPTVSAVHADDLTLETGQPYTFTVTYADNVGVVVASLAGGNLDLLGPHGFRVTPELAGVDLAADGTPRTATYRVPGSVFAGGWHNGLYSIYLKANQVGDAADNPAAAATIGTFNVGIAGSSYATARDLGTLTTAVSIADLVNSANRTEYFRFTLATPAVVNLSTSGLNITGIVELGSYDTARVVSTVLLQQTYPAASGQTGTVGLPAGTYYVAVRRQNGDASYQLNLQPVLDVQPPTATVDAGDIVVPSAWPYPFTITYTDAIAVNTATVGNGVVRVIGPNGFDQPATLDRLSVASNGSPRTATYNLPAPAGGWSSASNGTYTIELVAGQAADISGNGQPGGSVGTFTINIIDHTLPTATMQAGNITAAGSAGQLITVTYDDVAGINIGTIDAADLRVSSPSGKSMIVSVLRIDPPTSDPTSRTVVYQVAAPAGGWNVANNGVYSVILQPRQVADTFNNTAVLAILGSFSVQAPDANAPKARLAATSITASGATSYTFTVTYTDDVAMNLASVGKEVIQVTGPKNFHPTAKLVSKKASGGSAVVATYSIVPPSGKWSAAANGAYTVKLISSLIADSAGNLLAAPQPLGVFNCKVKVK